MIPAALVRLRAGIFLLQGRPSARLPHELRLSGAAESVLHRRRLFERRRGRPQDRREASRPLPRRRHQPRGHQCRSGEESQWEFQIFGKGSKKAAHGGMDGPLPDAAPPPRAYGIDVEFHCKPLGDTDWNGSGMHANFSTAYLREVGGKEYFEKLMAAFKTNRADHIAVYGPRQPYAPDRQARERRRSTPSATALPTRRSFDPRVPHSFANNGYKGLPGRPSPELARRPLPDRFAES